MVNKTLSKEEIFATLRPEQVHKLSEAAERIELKAGQTIYTQGSGAEHFYAVLSGKVALRLPGKQGFSVLIDELGPGSMFGSCVSFAMKTYSLTAQCTEDCALLKIGTSALKDLLDGDPRMGYAVQSMISEIYFKRYVETMKKLQAIVMTVPVEAV